MAVVMSYAETMVTIHATAIHVLSNVPYGNYYVLRRNNGDDSCDSIIHVLSNIPYGSYYVLRC